MVLPEELFLAAQNERVPSSFVRGFVNLIRRDVLHKHLNRKSLRKDILEQLCKEKDDWASHLFHVNRFYNMHIDD